MMERMTTFIASSEIRKIMYSSLSKLSKTEYFILHLILVNYTA